MSVISNLYQGVSGLNAMSSQMEVVGNNIANVNTVGYKAGRISFEEILGRSVLGSSGAGRIGNGTRISGVDQVFTQGSFGVTGQATDLAIAGEGFFMLEGQSGGEAGQFFTRAGQFRIDNEGFITAGAGLKLQGFQAGPGGVGSKIGALRVPTEPSPPSATAAIELRVGLEAGAAVRGDAFDVANPTGTSDFTTSVTVFDSLGQSHKIDVHMRKTAENEWTWHALAPTDEINGGDGFTEIGTGTMTFNSDGQLQTETGGSLGVTFAGAEAQVLSLNFGASIDEGGDGSGASEQFEVSGNQTLSIEQDGRASGVLQGIRVDPDGTVMGSFSNGEEQALGRVALARFAAPTGLDNIGGNLFRATGQSGEAVVGAADEGGRGAVLGATLEQSNVDLASEFVQLITAQRGFQANARTITTADEIYAETVNLKR